LKSTSNVTALPGKRPLPDPVKVCGGVNVSVRVGAGVSMVIEQDAPATDVVTSCTKTVKVVVPVVVGVPGMVPVAGLRVRPAGSALAPKRMYGGVPLVPVMAEL
jgi:hypothetical protein